MVVLPEPLGPIITTTCPRLTKRSTPFKTVRLPKRLIICSARTISVLCTLPFVCCSMLIAIPCRGSSRGCPNVHLQEYRRRAALMNQSRARDCPRSFYLLISYSAVGSALSDVQSG